ncbi:hypothetical protein HYX70_04700 [Candidatus Saccharibacteria bacterium]|nr:hypothetical protein [Candidatus Saccharibacteria bacterium]
MGFKDLTSKAKAKWDAYNEAAKQRAEEARKEHEAQVKAENERREAVLSGKLTPISFQGLSLDDGETAYYGVGVIRFADREYVTEVTTGKSKKKHVVSRGLVGGVLLGPVGLVAGAATAGSKHNSKTTQQTDIRTEEIDRGSFYLTNKRLLFVGSEILSLPYSNILAFSVESNKLYLKYPEMQRNEYFQVTDNNNELDLYYQGVQKSLDSSNK